MTAPTGKPPRGGEPRKHLDGVSGMGEQADAKIVEISRIAMCLEGATKRLELLEDALEIQRSLPYKYREDLRQEKGCKEGETTLALAMAAVPTELLETMRAETSAVIEMANVMIGNVNSRLPKALDDRMLLLIGKLLELLIKMQPLSQKALYQFFNEAKDGNRGWVVMESARANRGGANDSRVEVRFKYEVPAEISSWFGLQRHTEG